MLSGAVYGIGKYVILLLAVVAIFTTGTYLFTSGFLLSRHEIDVRSSCSKSKNSILWNNTDKNTCWTVPRISKVYTKFVVILIDALRFDFANYDDNTSKILPYTNRLSIFHELAKKHGCSSTRLFRFRADAPTTTMQRIKGLTTGSFPTFIDVSNNFDSAEITEDNFIDQFVESSNRNITFFGDDTWLKLFPGRFATSFAFPSFDVKNLHLVDDGIQEHLVSELQKDNWNMLIAHFIGVDHCGHRYGPLHSEMSAKLEEMDKMIRTVVNNMGDDTLLIVMGDHGMTQTGDHGGETLEEVDSALFAFHPGGKFSRRQLKNQNSCYADLIQQIDLVPTISVLLGVPIPFSNLGTIIPDLIPSTEQFATDKSSTSDSLSEALYVNAKQVENYLRVYNQSFENLVSPEFNQIMESFAKLKQNNLENIEKIQGILQNARLLCKHLWAQFDLNSMVHGICFFTILCACLLDKNLSSKTTITVMLALCASFVLYCIGNIFMGMCFLSLSLIICLKRFVSLILSDFMTFPAAVSVLFPLLYTSNSFVLSEDAISMYLCMSVLAFYSITSLCDLHYNYYDYRFSSVVRKATWKHRVKLVFRHPAVRCFVFLVFLFMLLRFAFLFRICRPEQFWCFNINVHSVLNKSSEELQEHPIYYIDEVMDFSDSTICLFLSGGSLIVLVFLFWHFLKREANLWNPYSAAVLCSTRLIPLATVCIIGHWQLQTLAAKELDALPTFYVTFLPRCAYCLLLLSFLLWWLSPLSVHLTYKDRYGRYRDEHSVLPAHDAAARHYQQLLKKVEEEDEQNNKTSSRPKSEERKGKDPPAVFGLFTVASAAVLGLGEVFILMLALLLEAKYAPVLVLFCLITWLILEILSSASITTKVSWNAVSLWSLSSTFWWFATGHQASLSSIPWNAAFVGFRGSHPTISLPAVMIGSNIFASQILHATFLPLVILWPFCRRKLLRQSYRSILAQKKLSNEEIEEFGNEVDFLQSDGSWHNLTDLFLKYLVLQALKVLGCMCAAFLHRRHLMVWQIFAPRFIYETLSFIVTCGSSILTYFFLVVIAQSLEGWLKKLRKRK
ncbi:GPI ethanolamine phosphate transferase 3, catalytic subunit-like [Clavelina lepadiformis]|uniref:GPI ethanolamine phosphate transferase 3, catalytic subunit-like n=1 Tax=Clavelina lepadiformis TaxID=159417 RepID=UPI0040435E33